MDPLSKLQACTPESRCQAPRTGTRAAKSPAAAAPADKIQITSRPDPVKAIPGRLRVAGEDIATGAGKAVHGIIKTGANAPLIAAEGVATAVVGTIGLTVYGYETIARAPAFVAGVVVGLGVDAVEAVGKGAQVLGEAAESLGDGAARLREGSDALLTRTTQRILELTRRGYDIMKSSFGAGVDAVSPKQ